MPRILRISSRFDPSDLMITDPTARLIGGSRYFQFAVRAVYKRGRLSQITPVMMLLSKIRVGPWRAALCAAMIMIGPAVAADHERAAYQVVGDEIPASLTGAPGDPARGRAIAAGREGNCLACHNMPIPEQQFHGDIGPNLAGIGARLSSGALRLRLVDAKRLSASTIMPSFYVVDGLQRVAPYYRGRPALNAEQIEDLVAYLSGLTEPPDVAQTR